jgi:hypothetical protein
MEKTKENEGTPGLRTCTTKLDALYTTDMGVINFDTALR